MAAVIDLETAVERLNAVALEDFVSERKRLAKELRDGGERATAAELAKLPKPSAAAWALNFVAREQPELVGEWLAAAETLRDASNQADRSSGDALRAAMTAHRDASRRLLAVVRDDARPNGRAPTEPTLDRVRELLQAATADPARAGQLRAARFVEGDDEQPPLSAPVAGDGDSDRPSKSRATKPCTAGDRKRVAQERAATRRAQREAEARAELERLVGEAEERVTALREAATDTEAAAAHADEQLKEAQRTLHRSESEAGAARQAAAEAADAAQQAERELRTLSAKLSS